MDQVESLLKRPGAYGNIDGTGELALGFMMWGYVLIMWLQLHTPKDSIWNQMYVLFIWVGLMVAIIHYGTKAIKNHITFPRTGFVAYRTRNMIWPAIIIFVVSALVGAGSAYVVFVTIRSHRGIAMPVLCIGLLFAACYAIGVARRVPWKWALVLAQVLGSLVIALLPTDLTGTLAHGSWATTMFRAEIIGSYLLCAMLFGALFLISGGISFLLYLRHTQAPTEEANEPANADVQ
jgi:hypothetical protein